MNNLVNIIHPHSYKMRGSVEEGFELVCGRIKEFEDRDRKVANFVKTALDSKIKILRHEFPPNINVEYFLQLGAISQDSFYGDLLFDERILKVTTLDNGEPIVDKRPKEIDVEKWNKFKDLFISDSELGRLIGNPERTFYIGGFFEACVKNMAYHQIKRYTPERDVFVIEEICASSPNDEKTQEVREGLQKDGIKIISYKEALELLQNNN